MKSRVRKILIIKFKKADLVFILSIEFF